VTSKEIKRIKKTLDAFEAGFVTRAKQLFDSILPEAQPYVEDVLRTGNVDGFELPGRKRYLVLFKRYLQELYAQGMTIADLELEAKRAKFDQHPSPAPIIPTNAMNWIDGWTSHFGDDYYKGATQDVVRLLKQGLGEGWSTEHTMKELGVYLGVTTVHGFNQRRLEVIARTNATSAFNQGRLETFRQAGDFVKFVQFLAILDSRTTDICESRNGRLLRLDSPELADNTPPLHYQCRSVLSPVTAYDLKEMEKPGWKDAEGRTLEQLQDWSKVEAPAKGFGRDIQDRLPNRPGEPPTQIGSVGGGKPPKPPLGGAGGGGPMEPELPWKKIPDDWLDKDWNADPEIEKFQRFIDKKVKPEIIKEYLLSEGIGAPGALQITSIKVNSYNSLEAEISAEIKVTGQRWKKWNNLKKQYEPNDDENDITTDTVLMIRTLHKNSKGKLYRAHFDLMGVGEAKLPPSFADEYYKRVIPFLKKIGVKQIDTDPTTTKYNPNSSEGRLLGAYVWCDYGYTNENMAYTLSQFLKYVKDVRGITLSNRQIAEINNYTRMRQLAQRPITVQGKDIKLGKEFLLGDSDGTGNYTHTARWSGIIPDIADETSDEMFELIEKLERKKH